MSAVLLLDLTSFLEAINLELFESGSTHFYKRQDRNNYKAVDLCYVDSKGEKNCIDCVEVGTPRKIKQRVYDDYDQYLGVIALDRYESITPATTKTLKQINGIK